MAAPAAPAPVRGSWRRLALGLGAFALAPLFPAIRAFVPIEQTLVLLAAVLAACALAGWRSGGRMSLAIVWVAIAGALLAAPAGPPGSSYAS
jgi:hypothetical protein